MRCGWAMLVAMVAATPAAAEPALLPAPATLAGRDAGFILVAGTPLVAADPGSRNAAARLVELMGQAGVALPAPSATTQAKIAVRFRRVAGLAAEAYRLSTSPAGAVIEASGDSGLLYGAVTLWQLATAATPGEVEGVAITDQPRFGWRGIMLDSARHPQSLAFIRSLVDAMMASKLNRLHWHLVDDQGWRLEIKRYPELTKVAGCRAPAVAPPAPPLPQICGSYSQHEVRALVAYAAQRGVTIVPEIEMPGHALSAIRANPKLGMGVPVPPSTEADWGVFPWLYNTEERTFTFLENVLDEVMALFPSRDIHTGGDEATKEQWKADPATQARIRALGLKDENALQGWFMARIGRYLAAHGRRLIGWDEILEGGVPANAAITSWRGVEGAVTAAKAGHDAVLSPDPLLYLNNRGGTGPDEPPGRGRLVSLADLLAFNPIPAGLTPEQARHILGLQANLWTEHTRTDARAAWMLFPRALAVAELGWSARAPGALRPFLDRLVPQIDRLASLGIAPADSLFAVEAALAPAGASTDKRIRVTLGGQSGLPIHVTTDGSAPTAAAPLYTAPLDLAPGTRLRAATFLGDRAMPGAADLTLTNSAALTRTSRQLTLCTEKVALDLEDDWPATGPRAHFIIDILNPCWRWDAAPVAGAARIAVTVGQLPFNFQVGADRGKITFRPPATPAGELEVRRGCDGPRLATLPLAPAAARPGTTRLEATLPPLTAPADLCFTYTASGPDPLWAIDRVELMP